MGWNPTCSGGPSLHLYTAHTELATGPIITVKAEIALLDIYTQLHCPLCRYRKYRIIRVVGWRVNFPSGAPANFAGLLAASQGIGGLNRFINEQFHAFRLVQFSQFPEIRISAVMVANSFFISVCSLHLAVVLRNGLQGNGFTCFLSNHFLEVRAYGKVLKQRAA